MDNSNTDVSTEFSILESLRESGVTAGLYVMGKLLEYCYEKNQFEELKESRDKNNNFIQPSMSDFLKESSCTC